MNPSCVAYTKLIFVLLLSSPAPTKSFNTEMVRTERQRHLIHTFLPPRTRAPEWSESGKLLVFGAFADSCCCVVGRRLNKNVHRYHHRMRSTSSPSERWTWYVFNSNYHVTVADCWVVFMRCVRSVPFSSVSHALLRMHHKCDIEILFNCDVAMESLVSNANKAFLYCIALNETTDATYSDNNWKLLPSLSPCARPMPRAPRKQ